MRSLSRTAPWRILLAPLALLTLLGPTAAMRLHADDDDAAQDLRDVEVGGLTLRIPADWEQQEPSSNLRLAQFAIPAEGDDGQAAELAVFSFGASSIEDNIERWINQFAAEEREVKVSTGECASGQYVFVELSGTYNQPVGPPIQGRTEPMPGARVMGVILASADGNIFFFKLAGLDETVAAQGDALRHSFGGDRGTEVEVDLGD